MAPPSSERHRPGGATRFGAERFETCRRSRRIIRFVPGVADELYTPIGRPIAAVCPQGTLIAGSPARFALTVNTSARDYLQRIVHALAEA